MELSTTIPDIVGIVGSRGPDPERGRLTGWPSQRFRFVLNLMARILELRHDRGLLLTIVSGGASSGVDRQVRVAARSLGMCFGEHMKTDPTSVDCPNDHFFEFLAEWHGPDGRGPLNRHAGYERNDKLVRHCGLLIALFADGEKTGGTSHAVSRAKYHQIPALIYHEGTWTYEGTTPARAV